MIKNEYLGNRAKYSSIEDFIPVILDYLKSLEGDTNLSTPAGELKEAHITGVYWNGDSAIIEPYLSNFKTRNDVVFLATISDWIDGQDYRQLVNFFDNSDYRFFLKAEGKPNISAKVISPFGNGDEKMWGYAFYIAPDQLSKMESGIQYKLAPLNGKDGYKWIINNGVTITKP